MIFVKIQTYKLLTTLPSIILSIINIPDLSQRMTTVTTLLYTGMRFGFEVITSKKHMRIRVLFNNELHVIWKFKKAQLPIEFCSQTRHISLFEMTLRRNKGFMSLLST